MSDPNVISPDTLEHMRMLREIDRLVAKTDELLASMDAAKASAEAQEAARQQAFIDDWNNGGYEHDLATKLMVDHLRAWGANEAVLKAVIENANPQSPQFQSRTLREILEAHRMSPHGPNVVQLNCRSIEGP